MPTSRPVRLTVIQTSGLAQTRIFFPTENEPIFRCRRPGLELERSAHFARIQSNASSEYAIQRKGVNSGSERADHEAAPAAIPCLHSPNPLQEIRKRSHFSPRGHHVRVARDTLRNAAQSQFATLSPGQSGVAAQPGSVLPMPDRVPRLTRSG